MLHVAQMLARFAIASNTPYDHPCKLETPHRHPPKNFSQGRVAPSNKRTKRGGTAAFRLIVHRWTKVLHILFDRIWGLRGCCDSWNWVRWSSDVFIGIFHSRHFSSILTVWPMIASFGLVAKYIVTMLRNHVQCSLSQTNRKFAMKGKGDSRLGQVGIHLVVQE